MIRSITATSEPATAIIFSNFQLCARKKSKIHQWSPLVIRLLPSQSLLRMRRYRVRVREACKRPVNSERRSDAVHAQAELCATNQYNQHCTTTRVCLNRFEMPDSEITSMTASNPTIYDSATNDLIDQSRTICRNRASLVRRSCFRTNTWTSVQCRAKTRKISTRKRGYLPPKRLSRPSSLRKD